MILSRSTESVCQLFADCQFAVEISKLVLFTIKPVGCGGSGGGEKKNNQRWGKNKINKNTNANVKNHTTQCSIHTYLFTYIII